VPTTKSDNERGNPYHSTKDGKFARKPGGDAGSATNGDDGKTKPKGGGGSHTVVKGDTLWDIAEKYYGDGSKWTRIYEANKDEIEDPDLIYPGQEFEIPGGDEDVEDDEEDEEDEDEDEDEEDEESSEESSSSTTESDDEETSEEDAEAAAAEAKEAKQARRAANRQERDRLMSSITVATYANADKATRTTMAANSEAGLERFGFKNATAAMRAGYKQRMDGSWVKPQSKKVEKYNPFHDRIGRFSSAGSAVTTVPYTNRKGVAVRPGKTYDIRTNAMRPGASVRARVEAVEAGKHPGLTGVHIKPKTALTGNHVDPKRVSIMYRQGKTYRVLADNITEVREINPVRQAAESTIRNTARGAAAAAGVAATGAVVYSQLPPSAQAAIAGQVSRAGGKVRAMQTKKKVKRMWNFEKYNPYHARDGKFTTAGGAVSITRLGGKNVAATNTRSGASVRVGETYDMKGAYSSKVKGAKGTYDVATWGASKGARMKVTEITDDGTIIAKPQMHMTMRSGVSWGMDLNQYNSKTGTAPLYGVRPIRSRKFAIDASEVTEAKPVSRARVYGARAGAAAGYAAAFLPAAGMAWAASNGPNMYKNLDDVEKYNPYAPSVKPTQSGGSTFGIPPFGPPILRKDQEQVDDVQKYNPYHARDGRFTSASNSVKTVPLKGGARTNKKGVKVEAGKHYDFRTKGMKGEIRGKVLGHSDDGHVYANIKSTPFNLNNTRVATRALPWMKDTRRVKIDDITEARQVNAGRVKVEQAFQGLNPVRATYGGVAGVASAAASAVVPAGGAIAGWQIDQKLAKQLCLDAGVSPSALLWAASNPGDDAAPLAKSVGTVITKAVDEKRYTLGPVYSPGLLDAHKEFVEKEDLHQTMWGYVRKNDRTLWRQHRKGVEKAGEYVEIMTWPHEVETTMLVPQEDGTKVEKQVKFPAGTTFMGVIWEPEAWEDVKKGKLLGFSMGGRARRIEAEFAGDEVQKAAPKPSLDAEIEELADALGIPVEELIPMLEEIDEEIRNQQAA
jgi:LysM repeat protein